VHGHLRAALGQEQGVRAPEAAPGACDERDLSVEADRAAILSRRWL
jgi:hypothetical protein